MAIGRRLHWWQWIPRRAWRLVLVVDEADEIPTRLPRKAAALVGPDANPKWVAFDCPCRRGHRVMLNLDRRRRPSWTLVTRQPLTLHPSIDDHGIDRCHFFVRAGTIAWAPSRTEVDP
jgi:hypothetical protein